MVVIIGNRLLKPRLNQVHGFSSCKPFFTYKQRCFPTVAIKGRRDYDVVNKKRLIWSWMVASLCCRFMHLIFFPSTKFRWTFPLGIEQENCYIIAALMVISMLMSNRRLLWGREVQDIWPQGRKTCNSLENANNSFVGHILFALVIVEHGEFNLAEQTLNILVIDVLLCKRADYMSNKRNSSPTLQLYYLDWLLLSFKVGNNNVLLSLKKSHSVLLSYTPNVGEAIR